MIEYIYETSGFTLDDKKYTDWLIQVIESEGFKLGDICYVFVDDESLRAMNKKYLNHDYYTDIITFDYSEDGEISGDLFISLERVKENSGNYKVSMEEEARRVMVHGVLHLMGLKDTTSSEKDHMREMENQKMNMFHVEQ